MDLITLTKQILGSVLSGNVPPSETMSLFISKMLGVGILAGSCIVKLPQLISILRASSAKGISLLSVEVENYVYLVHVSYGIVHGLPITAFGEAAIMWLQNSFLLSILFWFKGANMTRVLMAILIFLVVSVPVSLGVVTPTLATTFYDINSTVYLISKVPQVLHAFREGSTGQLSAITSFLQFVGSFIRVFTSIREKAGPAMVRGFISGTTVNGLLLGQIIYYNLIKPSPEETKKIEEKKEE